MDGRGMKAGEPCSIPLPFIPLPISVQFALPQLRASLRQIFAAREEFTDGDPASGGEIDLVLRLDGPARRGEHRVYPLPGFFLGAHWVGQIDWHRSPQMTISKAKRATCQRLMGLTHSCG